MKLTEYSHAGGCGCKIDPSALAQILEKVPKQWGQSSKLLVGIESSDDAAVMEINEHESLVFSSDFSTPIVDDPYTYGCISAANALSDIYAMGADPLMATAIVGFPVNKLPMESMQEIMRGAVEVCQEGGIPLAGGHSIDNPQPVFGLSVIGMAHTRFIKTNSGAKVGDVLILTKPLGIGILASAIKAGTIRPSAYKKFIRHITQLNKPGSWLGKQAEVHALTDVTGFGLAGHLMEMAKGARVRMEIDTTVVPVMEEAWALVEEGVVPSGAYRNMHSYGDSLLFEDEWNIDHQLVFTDPQTNGGLLMAVTPEKAEMYLEKLREFGFAETAVIGQVTAQRGTDAPVVFNK
ncbi:MAG: selenide, water dikinase SelD [Gammaproteobacteria bacterium]|nr:selenide, water dikinase SelD [Gammaproteobacteria bacterium]